jgi:hypothetical protein
MFGSVRGIVEMRLLFITPHKHAAIDREKMAMKAATTVGERADSL